MSDGGDQRRLSAILAADMVGYTRRMEDDTDGTVAAWKAARADIIDPTIAEHSGRIVKHTGDGFLAEFPTVLDAVQCATIIQQTLANSPLDFRMGVHLGDIVDDGEDIHGEGVNIAARIEGLAEPGSICLSSSVYEQVRNRLDHHFEDMGEHEIKHVSAPVRVYRIVFNDVRPVEKETSDLALPDKPSIAVLPFTVISGDPEQEFFADGLVEDIITTLSKLAGLRVVARNSTFVYKGQPIDIRAVAKQLEVRYVLEGSVRKSGDRIRVTTQLIEADSGSHIWAERYDRAFTDIFAVQDEITLILATEMQVKLTDGEQARLRYTTTDNVEAWTYWVQGLSRYHQEPRQDNLEAALRCWERALALDPSSAPLNAMIGLLHYVTARFGWRDDQQSALSTGMSYIDRALELDPENA